MIVVARTHRLLGSYTIITPFLQVAKGSLTSVTGHVHGRYIASGCTNGSVYIMSVGSTLTDLLGNEKSTILQVNLFFGVQCKHLPHKVHSLNSDACINTCKGRFTCSSHVLQMMEAETIREKNIEKAQKEAKVRARKEGAKSIFLQDVGEVHLLDDVRVSFI